MRKPHGVRRISIVDSFGIPTAGPRVAKNTGEKGGSYRNSPPCQRRGGRAGGAVGVVRRAGCVIGDLTTPAFGHPSLGRRGVCSNRDIPFFTGPMPRIPP